MSDNCGPDCSWVFGDLTVMPLMRGGTRVTWTLHPQFRDAGPYTFQLQFGRTGNPLADDWVDVGPAVSDTYYADDPEQRLYGMQFRGYYRILLTTTYAEYVSRPANIVSSFDFADIQRVRGLLSQEYRRLSFKAGNKGYLLKRRVFGTPCPICVDRMTSETRVPDCITCYGTGIVGGYFEPYPCFYAEFTLKSTREHVSDMGTLNDGPVSACRLLNQPPVNSYDVWVDKDADTRWFVHSIKSEVEVRSVPIILFPVELRMAPFSHIIYQLPIDGQQDP